MNNDSFKDALLIYVANNNLYHKSNLELQNGLFYLAEYANLFAYSVLVKSFSSENPIISSICELVEMYKFRILGFYTDCENIWIIRQILPELKALHPSINFILGGPQITGVPEQTLRRIPEATCGVIGEGEITFLKLLQLSDFNFSNLQNIKGIVFLQNDEFKSTGSPELLSDLDIISFPHVHEYTTDQNVLYNQLITGRGCVGKCAFCFEGRNIISKPRLRKINNCIAEIEYLVTQFPEQKYISILDDTFILNRDRTKQFCEQMIEKFNGKVKWFCEARVDTLLNVIDLLPLMKQAGLVRIQLGGESGSEKILEVYNKGTTKEQMIEVVSQIHKIGIASAYINFIIGGAFETIETFEETLSFAKNLIDIAPGCASVGASLFSPSPGSPMYEHPELYGIKIIDKELLRGEECLFPFVETESLNQYQMLNLYYRFVREIDSHYLNCIPLLSKDQIKDLYFLSKNYSCSTEWFEKIILDERNNKYFKPIIEGNYKSVFDLTASEINYSIPIRTSMPTTDGFAFYRKNREGEEIRNSDLESAIISLSAGKLSYSEIVSIIKDNMLCQEGNGTSQIDEIYRMLDEELNIIWKCKF